MTGQLEVLTVTVQQLLRKKEEEKAYLCQNSRGNNYFRCGESGHFIRDCISEKVLATWDPSWQKRPTNFNWNTNRTGSWRPRQRESNYIKEDVRYYVHDPEDRNVEPVVYRVDMDQGGLAVWTTIWVKGHPVKAIVDSRASVFIIS